MSSTIIISRSGEEDDIRRDFEDALAAACAASGWQVLLTPSLYHLPEAHPCWEDLRAQFGGAVLCTWLHARPVEWLLRRHGVEQPPAAVLNLADYATAEGCHAAILERRAAEQATPGACREIDAAVSERWYPVVDRARCNQCRHCLQFCLFGVYEADAQGQPGVRNPDRCKPGCPACSRICPQGAIIFPLYEKDAAIAGAPGMFMAPDAAARKMFYTRTKQPCPRCGATPDTVPAASPAAPLCPECGRPLPTAETATEWDDIDALIDDLDRLAKGKG